MPFLYLALFVLGQLPKCLPKMRPQLPVQRFSSTLRNEQTTWYLHSHLLWLRLSLSFISILLSSRAWRLTSWSVADRLPVKLLLPPRYSRGISYCGLKSADNELGKFPFVMAIFSICPRNARDASNPPPTKSSDVSINSPALA